jgi:threonine aldolase
MADPTMELALTCRRFLSGGDPRASYPRRVLLELAEGTPDDLPPDLYGEAEQLQRFEREVAELLGKEAAVFMPSGTMAQQIALRLWSGRRGTTNVAFHPRCHLELHEQKGYQVLHGLHGVLVGDADRLIALPDVERVAEPLAALLLELPQRELGGVLPSWDDLVALTGWARARQIPLHMDGARLWECGPHYRRPYAEIAALFDTVYVSFYKGLRGISGAILAGPAPFVQEARVWLRRHGGNLFRMWPYALAARAALAKRLPKMEAYHAHAVAIAHAISAVSGVSLIPDPPHTNMMHVFLRADPERLLAARDAIARERGVFLFRRVSPTRIPAVATFELTVVDESLELQHDEVRALFTELMERAA